MLAKLFLLFITVPLIEIVLFIEIGSRIGTMATLFVVVITALIVLSRWINVLREYERAVTFWLGGFGSGWVFVFR